MKEPTAAEVAHFAPRLATLYNDPHNSAMLGHGAALTVDDVHEHYQRLWRERAVPLLLFRDGALLGDADVRAREGDTAEVAILVGSRADQGRGLGTAFAIMIHGLAFRLLGLEQLYVSILPHNVASRRLFDKLGYHIDNGAFARAHADEDTDITMSITRDRFERAHAAALGELLFATE